MKLFGEKLVMEKRRGLESSIYECKDFEIMVDQDKSDNGATMLLNYAEFKNWLKKNDWDRVLNPTEVFATLDELPAAGDKGLVDLQESIIYGEPEYLNMLCTRLDSVIQYLKPPLHWNGKEWKTDIGNNARFVLHDVRDGMNNVSDIFEQNKDLVKHLFGDNYEKSNPWTDGAVMEIPRQPGYHRMYLNFPNISLTHPSRRYAVRGVRKK